VEFPELSRILADEDMEILFVPFWTDTKNAYLRVRRCAQARAIENECYVAIAGSVGNLPRVENMDIQYAQTAVFSPSDFSFPHDAIVAEATPNTETTVVVDLDLDLLKELRTKGSVRNLQQRRKDLYKLTFAMMRDKG
jgi:predicted amidohydrolase